MFYIVFIKYYFCLQAPDYYDIITEPMDFGTVTNNIHNFAYTEPGSLIADIHLIFQNCFHYNMETADVYMAGRDLSKYFQKRLKELKLDHLLPATAKKGSSPKQQPKKRTSKGKWKSNWCRTQVVCLNTQVCSTWKVSWNCWFHMDVFTCV